MSMEKMWIFAPAKRCVEFIAEEAKIGALLHRSLTHIEMGRPLFDLLKQQFMAADQTEAADLVDVLLASAPYHEEWAKHLRQTDYAALNAHATVAIWAALETCLEDTVVAILANDASAISTIKSLGVKVKHDEREATQGLGNYRRVFESLHSNRRVKGSNVIATYEAVLDVFGLSARGRASEEALLELNSVRNCIVHRGGVVDEMAIRAAPSLHGLLGNEVVVSRSDFLRYHEAVSDWTISLMESINASKYQNP